jgi:hypothetical protein
MAEKIESVRAGLARIGQPMAPNDRLSQMAALFTGPEGNLIPIRTASQEFPVALEASREFALLEYTLDHWAFDRKDGRALVMLKHSIQDPMLQWDRTRPARGKSLQLELFVASMCHRAGFDPVKLGDPDVQCVVRDKPFGVAVKRALSPNDVMELVRDATEQVLATGDRGIVFLDISCAFHQRFGFVTRPLTDAETSELHAAWVRKCIEPWYGQLKRTVRGNQTLGVYFWSSFLRFAPGSGWQPETLLMDVDTSQENRSHRRLFAAFRSTLAEAYPPQRYVPVA